MQVEEMNKPLLNLQQPLRLAGATVFNDLSKYTPLSTCNYNTPKPQICQLV